MSVSITKTVAIFLVVAICGCERSQPTGSLADEQTRRSIEAMAANANEKTPEGQYFLCAKIQLEAQICNTPDERDAKLATAKEWCRKSAEGGYFLAQGLMAIHCFNDKKLIESYAWRGVRIYQCERMKDLEDLVPSFVEIQERQNLDDEQLAKAKTLTAEYIEKYVDLENNGYQ